jgi:hypothetical protein
VSWYQIPQPLGPKIRPGTVKAAAALSYLTAVLLVGIGVLTAVVIASSVSVTYTNPDTQAAAGNAVPVVTGILYGAGFGLAAIAQSVLTIFVQRGANPARIMAWVLDGLLIVCCGCFGINSSLGSGLSDGLNTSSNSMETIHSDLPAWFGPVEVTSVVLLVLVLMVVVILLALPASNQFFRRADQMWTPANYGVAGPMYPSAGYPGVPNPSQYGGPWYPQYPEPPPYPGQPQYPGQPTYPGLQTPYPGQPPFPGQAGYPQAPFPGQYEYPQPPSQAEPPPPSDPSAPPQQ